MTRGEFDRAGRPPERDLPPPPPSTLIARALRGRCPACGIGPVMRSWLTMNPGCAACHLRFDRGREEEEDYWLGAFTLNFIVTEMLFGLALLVALLVTWPDPPWTLLLYGGGALMALAPIIFYPCAKALWLALDLVFRPARPEDFEP